MVIVYFDSGASTKIDCSLQAFIEAGDKTLKKGGKFVYTDDTAVNIEKITHIEEVEEV